MRRGEDLLAKDRSVRPRPNPSVVVREDGEGAIALHLQTQEYFELNATAWFVWGLLVSGSSVDEIAVAITTTYGLPDSDASLVLEELLDTLESEGLLESDRKERRRDRLRRWWSG